MKMKKKSLRFVAGVLAVTMLISSNSVFATTTAEYDEQIESIKSQQAENEAEAERLNEKLDSLRDQTSEAEAYQATLEEQITTYQTSIDLAVQNITQLNTNITNLEAEIKKADEEYADTFAELKVRLRSLYASGGNLTTLQILFDSTSLYDFSMRSEAMKTITKHDRELMEKIRLYRIQTQDQRDELNKEKEELADQKKDLEKKQEELQALEEENQKLIDELNVQSSETESDLAAAEAAKEDYVSQLDQLIADRNAQAEKEEEARRQAEANQNAANNNSGSGNTSSGSGNTSDVLNTGDLSFSWPLAGYGYGSITQYFGGMFSGSAVWTSAFRTVPPFTRRNPVRSSLRSTTGPGAITCSSGTTVHIPRATRIAARLQFPQANMWKRARSSAMSAPQVSPRATTSTLRSTRMARALTR